MQKKWAEKTTVGKILTVISRVAMIIWIVFWALNEWGSFPNSDIIANFALAFVCLCEIYEFWNVKRVISYVAIAGSVFILAITIVALVMQ